MLPTYPNPNPNQGHMLDRIRVLRQLAPQSPRRDLEAAGLLTEHFKQTELGLACAISATAALEKKEGKLDHRRKKSSSTISAKAAPGLPRRTASTTVRSLLDMMMMTGVIHGSWLLAL